MTLSWLKEHQQFLLLKCISGSKAYGLDLPTSDTDYKGVFYSPVEQFYSLEFVQQLNNDSNDEMYYELGRYLELLYRNNPNILELLSTPDDCILFKHPVLDRIKPELFLSKLCKDTFAGYAQTQIKRARGLNKKIMNPVAPELKPIIEFCYIAYGQGSIPLTAWLKEKRFNAGDCGLSTIPHMRDTYGIYHVSQFSEPVNFKGIFSSELANDVLLSQVPRLIDPLGIVNFNKDGYSVYRREYKEYEEWLSKRNEERYQSTIDHGKNYDAKNMMHVFRLLNMAGEIAVEGKVNVRRKDREALLKVRRGEYQYEDLVKMAEDKIDCVNGLYQSCNLPEKPEAEKINALLVELRRELYGKAHN